MNKFIWVLVALIVGAGLVIVPQQLQARNHKQEVINEFIAAWKPDSLWEDKLQAAETFLAVYDTLPKDWMFQIIPSAAKASDPVCEDVNREIFLNRTFTDRPILPTYSRVKQSLNCQ